MKFEFQKLNYNIKNFIHNELVKLSQYIKPSKEPPNQTNLDEVGPRKTYDNITSSPNNRKNSRKLKNHKIEGVCSPIKAKETEALKSVELAPKRVKVKIRSRTGTIPRSEEEHITLNKNGRAPNASKLNGKKDEKNTLKKFTHDNIAGTTAGKNMDANNHVNSTNLTKDVNMVEHDVISNFKYKLKLFLHNEAAKLNKCIKSTIEIIKTKTNGLQNKAIYKRENRPIEASIQKLFTPRKLCIESTCSQNTKHEPKRVKVKMTVRTGIPIEKSYAIKGKQQAFNTKSESKSQTKYKNESNSNKRHHFKIAHSPISEWTSNEQGII